jgi:hypothetical protein
VEPNYGLQKARVGVKLASGAYVPDGTTTAGSVVSYVVEGPNIDGQETGECTTVTPEAEGALGTEGDSTTYCPGNGLLVWPGNTMTLTQTSAAPGLTVDHRTVVVEPCVIDPATGQGCETVPVIFSDVGTPPSATDDSGTVDNTGSLTLDVLGNDDSAGAPITGLALSRKPAHGRARVLAASGLTGRRLGYVPAPGFVGVDSFSYTFTTGNGAATADVSVTVTGTESKPPVSEPSTPAPSTPAPSTPVSSTPAPVSAVDPRPTSSVPPQPAALASTGSPAAAGAAGLLGVLLTGTGAALLGRRRRTRPRRD